MSLFLPSHAPRHAGRLPERAFEALREISLRWRRRRDQDATVAILNGLDDRALRDIGLSRGEIESVVHDEDGERLRRYEPEWRRARRMAQTGWV